MITSASLAVILTLLLHSPIAVGAVLTTPQLIQLGLLAAQKIPQAIIALHELKEFLETPQFREWAARNGEAAIRLQPGIITER